MNPIENEENWSSQPPIDAEERWQALFRASVLTTTTNKFFNYIALADQKAQGMVILNSIIIPVALTWAEKPSFQYSALLSIATSVISIFFAIMCIYPKRRKGRRPDGKPNLLHFNDIHRLSEQEFLEQFNPIVNSNSALCLATVKDLHDISLHVMRPKFFWLKAAYISFFIGNCLSLLTILFNVLN